MAISLTFQEPKLPLRERLQTRVDLLQRVDPVCSSVIEGPTHELSSTKNGDPHLEIDSCSDGKEEQPRQL